MSSFLLITIAILATVLGLLISIGINAALESEITSFKGNSLTFASVLLIIYLGYNISVLLKYENQTKYYHSITEKSEWYETNEEEATDDNDKQQLD